MTGAVDAGAGEQALAKSSPNKWIVDGTDGRDASVVAVADAGWWWMRTWWPIGPYNRGVDDDVADDG